MNATAIKKYAIGDLPAPAVIVSDTQHDKYVSTLLALEGQKHLTREDRNYAELLTVLIENYEQKHYTIPVASPLEVLQELMAENNLKQRDLALILGAESTVSEVLSGKRELAKSHIQKLSKRFNVSPAVFF